jgi:hypothetical protein
MCGNQFGSVISALRLAAIVPIEATVTIEQKTESEVTPQHQKVCPDCVERWRQIEARMDELRDAAVSASPFQAATALLRAADEHLENFPFMLAILALEEIALDEAGTLNEYNELLRQL